MKKLTVILLALASVYGCAGSFTEIPEGAKVLRCTEYAGTSGSPVGSARADGCQCIQVGELTGTIRVELDSCEITLSP